MSKFKKMLSIFIAVTLIFGMITIPAFGAPALKYEDKARVLNKLDLFKGISEKEYVPNLEAKLLREEAVALLLRMFGLEDEALKLTEREANSILNRFKDADKIAAWAIKHIAFAVEEGVIVGRPDGNFAPKDNLLGREYSKMILAMLGYVQGIDFQYEFSTIEFCSVTGFSQQEGSKLDETTILRDDVVGMSYYALTAEYAAGKNKGMTVIEAIVGNNEKLREIAINEGLIEEAVVVSVDAISDISVKVGQLLKLPDKIKAVFSDGKTADVSVNWPYIDTSKPMSRTQIKGTIDGTDVTAKVYVTIEDAVIRVNNVTADNLIEVVVNYNQDISDNKEVEKKENYSLDVAKIKSIETSGNTAVLTLEKSPDNQKKAKLTINEKILPAKETFEFTFFDATLPEIISLEVTGPKEFTVTFTEPIEDSKDGKVTVKTGSSSLSVNKNEIEVGKAKVKIPLYSSLVDGKEYVVTIQGFKDYAGYNNVIKTITFTYIKDLTPPLATVETANQEYVVIKFNKPVSGLYKEQFSHTFSAWTASEITEEDGTAIDPTKSYDKVYVWFYLGDKKLDRPIPEGSSTLRVLGKVTGSDDSKVYEIKDLWGNKFETETYIITVKSDKSIPEVKKISVIAENAIEIEFSKKVVFEKDNIEVLDNNGKTISGLTLDIESSSDPNKFTVTFNQRLAGKTVIVNIKNVYDATINSNKLDYYSETIDITDKTPPELTKVTYSVEKDGSKEVAWFLYVFYNEDVDGETALNVGNYYLKNGSIYTKLSDTAEFYAGEKIIKISLTSKEKDLVQINLTELFVVSVRDMAGNDIMPSLEIVKDMTAAENAPYIKEAVAIEQNKIVVTFSEELGTYDRDAFEIKLDGVTKTVKVDDLDEDIDEKGRTQLTLLIDGRLPSNTSADKIIIVQPKAITNLFGVMPAITEKIISDGIKPELIEKKPIIISDDGKIVIRFTEALDDSTIPRLYIPLDLEIYKKSDSENSLTAGTEYTVVIDNTHERPWIEGEYIDIYGKVVVTINSVMPNETYRISSRGTISYIKDTKGNTAKPFTKVTEIKGSDLVSGVVDALDSAKTEAAGKNGSDYTEGSWSDLQDALALPEGTYVEIVNKTNAINTAITNLVFAGKAGLDVAISEGDALEDEGNDDGSGNTIYTTESWNDFISAYAAAKLLPETTNQEILDKTAAVNEAIGKLVTHLEAFNDAVANANDGDTIKLTSDITKATTNITKLANLNLNGYTLTGNVDIASNASGTLNISNGMIDGNLTVDTPNATVNNTATVTGTIIINGISDSTWNENISGNIIIVDADNPAGLNIGDGHTLGTLTLNSPATIIIGEGAGIGEPIVINAPVTIISSEPIQAIIGAGIEVIVKETADGEEKVITGSGSEEPMEIITDPSTVETKEQLISTINNSKIPIVKLAKDIIVDEPVALNRTLTLDGNGKTLTINSGEDKTGDNSSEGLGIFANGVQVKDITVKGNHGDNLIEIYNNKSGENLSVTLEDVGALDGKKAGIYVNKNSTGTITVNFENITTSGNGWDAGIGLAAQVSGSKVKANFSGTHSIGESVALYHEGTTYQGTYEVTGLEGYFEKAVDKQVKWFKNEMFVSFVEPGEVPDWYETAKGGDASLPAKENLEEVLGSTDKTKPAILTKDKWYYAAIKTIKTLEDSITGLQIQISYEGATAVPAAGDIFMLKMCDLDSSGEGQPKTWYTNPPVWGDNFIAGNEYDDGLVTYVFIKAIKEGTGNITMQFKQGDKVVSNVLVGEIKVQLQQR